MGNITIITEVCQGTKGDFFAGKKLAEALMSQGHKVEWILKVDKGDLPLPLDEEFKKKLQATHILSYPQYITEGNSFDEQIVRQAPNLAQRDQVIVFPAMIYEATWRKDWAKDYIRLKESGVNLSFIHEYGHNAKHQSEGKIKGDLKNFTTTLRNHDIPIYTTGAGRNDDWQRNKTIPYIELRQEEDLSSIKKEIYETPTLIKQGESLFVYGQNKGGLVQITQLNGEVKDYIGEYIENDENKVKYEDRIKLIPLTEKIRNVILQKNAHLENNLGMFLNESAISKTTLNSLSEQDLQKNQSFFKELLNLKTDEEINQKELQNALGEYDKSHALFFSYTNVASGGDKKPFEDLVDHFRFCLKKACSEKPIKTHIDFIGRIDKGTKEAFRQALEEESLPNMEIRLLNPFPLGSTVFAGLLNKAKADRNPVLITGDQSLGEVIVAVVPFTYQACEWKTGLACELLSLCDHLKLPDLKLFLQGTFRGATKELKADVPDDKLVKIFNELNIEKTFAKLKDSIADLSQTIQQTFPSSEPKQPEITPLEFEEMENKAVIKQGKAENHWVVDDKYDVVKSCTFKITNKPVLFWLASRFSWLSFLMPSKVTIVSTEDEAVNDNENIKNDEKQSLLDNPKPLVEQHQAKSLIDKICSFLHLSK